MLSIASKVYLKFTQCSIRVKAPNIDEFPGSIPSILPHLQVVPNGNTQQHQQQFTKIIDIKSKYDEFHCTGCYLAAGGCAQITVVEGNPSGWEVRVGAHTDDLTSMDEIRRWPQLSVAVKLKKSVSLTSAFGGLIYVESPKGTSSIRLKIESVLEAPYYDLNRPETMSAWSTSRKAPGLWAELCGKVTQIIIIYLVYINYKFNFQAHCFRCAIGGNSSSSQPGREPQTLGLDRGRGSRTSRHERQLDVARTSCCRLAAVRKLDSLGLSRGNLVRHGIQRRRSTRLVQCERHLPAWLEYHSRASAQHAEECVDS